MFPVLYWCGVEPSAMQGLGNNAKEKPLGAVVLPKAFCVHAFISR